MAKNKALNPSFRDSLGGYRKEDVNQYIEQMNLRFSENEKQYKEEIAAWKEKAESASSSDAASLHAALDLAQKDAEEARRLLSEKEEQIALLTKELEEARAEAVKESGSAASAEMPSYEQMSSRLGNVLLIADKQAETIVSDAKKEAASLIEAAKKEADDMRKETRVRVDDLYSAINLKMRSVADEYLSGYLALFQDITGSLDKLSGSMKDRSDLLHKEIDAAKDEIGAHLELTLSGGNTEKKD